MSNSIDRELTKPSLKVNWKSIPEQHKPENAKYWDCETSGWKYCFATYRHLTFGDTVYKIAEMLDVSHGYARVLRSRVVHEGKDENGKDVHKYIKFRQSFVDKWPEIALKELTKIHGDKEYANSLLP